MARAWGPRMHSGAHTDPKMSSRKAGLSLPTFLPPCPSVLPAAATGVSVGVGVGVGVSGHSPAPFPAGGTPQARR